MIPILILQGVYANEIPEWRSHLEGAAAFVAEHLKNSPWAKSREAWVVAQSLALSYEIALTSSIGSNARSSITDKLLRAVSSTDRFGFTIGSCGSVIRSLSTVRVIGGKLKDASGSDFLQLSCQISDVLRELDRAAETLEDPSSFSQITLGDTEEFRKDYLYRLHGKIFCNAVLVYLKRVCFNATPGSVQPQVSAILTDMIEFLSFEGGSISLWPVFIAAVESCDPLEKDMVHMWFQFSERLGIGNRILARKIIEAVWTTRTEEAERKGLGPSEVTVDWMLVQHSLGLDICLL